MNGPQRTACLAKWYNNDKYKWIEVFVMGKNRLETETHSLHLWKQVPDLGGTWILWTVRLSFFLSLPLPVWEMKQQIDDRMKMTRWTATWAAYIAMMIKNAPFKIPEGGGPIKKCWQGDQLEHTCKPYTDGQLDGYIPVDMRWRTRHGSTESRNHGSTDGQTICNS